MSFIMRVHAVSQKKVLTVYSTALMLYRMCRNVLSAATEGPSWTFLLLDLRGKLGPFADSTLWHIRYKIKLNNLRQTEPKSEAAWVGANRTDIGVEPTTFG